MKAVRVGIRAKARTAVHVVHLGFLPPTEGASP